MNKKTSPDSGNNLPPDEELLALSIKAKQDAVCILEYCEQTIELPSKTLFALILATASLARGMDMDIHSLVSGIMAAYKGGQTLVVLEKPEGEEK